MLAEPCRYYLAPETRVFEIRYYRRTVPIDAPVKFTPGSSGPAAWLSVVSDLTAVVTVCVFFLRPFTNESAESLPTIIE